MANWPESRVQDFTQGYIDKYDDTKLPAGSLKACMNMISRQIGRISSRNGQAKLNTTEIGSGAGVQGLHAFYKGSSKYLIVAVAGSVYYCTPPDGTMTEIKTGLDATAPVIFVTAFVDGANQIMGFNGVNTPFKWDGTTVSDLNDYRIVTREEPTTTDFTVYALANKPIRLGSSRFFVFSNNDLLTYDTDYTIDAENGTFTCAAARVNAVTDRTSDDAATVTYPLNGRIESLHPYKVGCTVTIYDKSGNVLKALTDETSVDDWKADYANGVVTAPTTIDYTNLMPLATTYQWTDVIKVDYQYSNGTVSTQFRYPVTHRGRVFVMAGDERIYWSDITENGSEYECWPPINNWPVNQGKGESDGCMIPLINDLYIFMSRSIHRFRGTSLDDFNLTLVEPSVGCAGPRAACLDGDVIYLISEEGLYNFNGIEAVNISRDKIPQLWKRVNKPYLYQSAVFAWDGLILFAVPIDGSLTNNLVIALDTSTGAFWLWDAMNVAEWSRISTTSGTKLYSGDCSNGFIYEQDTGTDDAGVNIASYFELPTLDVGSPERMKKSRYCYVEYAPDQATFGTCKGSKDYADFVELTAVNSDNNECKFALRPNIVGKWRYFTLRLEHNQAGKFEIRSVMLPVKTKDKPSVKGAVE